MRILHYLLFLLFFFNNNHFQAQILSNPSACGLNLPITDFNCTEDGVTFNPDQFFINVNNAPGTVLGVDVYLSEVQLIIQHEWVNDLDVVLIGPNGNRSAILTSDNGGGDDNYGDPDDPTCGAYASFSTASCFPIQDGVAPFTEQAYSPEEHFFIFNDNVSNPNGSWVLQICDDFNGDIGSLEYVNLIFEPIICLPVTEIEVLGIDSVTVALDWMPTVDCQTTVIEYGLPGFTPGNGLAAGEGTVVVIGCPPYALETGLEDTALEIYIRKQCSSNSNFSVNSCPVLVQTGCQPMTTTIKETFDDQLDCTPLCGSQCNLTSIWWNGPGDEFDWIADSLSTNTFGTGPSDDISGGGKYVYIETSGSSCLMGSKAYLFSNCIEFNKMGADTCHMAFSYHMFGSNTGSLALEVSVDGGFTWASIWQRQGNRGNKWHKEYLGLNNYQDGAILQFRFVGKKGNGSRGDIALDDIRFFGSTDLGFPSNQYFVDNDEDGYGEANSFLWSCAAFPPIGYSSNDMDCDDTNQFVNPGEDEIPCDGFDNNCNGMEDDDILPPPMVTNDTVCSGTIPEICGTPQDPANTILWFSTPEFNFDNLVWFGACYEAFDLPENNSPEPVEYRFYAAETNFMTCFSEPLAEAVIVVNPKPDAFSNEMPAICPGESIELSSLTIEDANFTGGEVTFHDQSPATSANELSSTLVTPIATTTYYYLITSPDGCSDEGSMTVIVKPGPDLSFFPADSFSLCKEATTIIDVVASGGTPGYSYLWNDGSTTEAIEIESAFQPGTIDEYGVTVTDSEGCFSVDTVFVTTTNSIDSVRRSVTNVSTCMGTDGSITVIPLNGLSPFSYHWEGSNGVVGDAMDVPDTLVISNLPQGAYRVTITDNSSQMCDFSLRSIFVNGPGAVVDSVEVEDVSCDGSSDGSICVALTGGNNPQFLWSNDSTTQCITNLSGGTYSVTVTDGMCETILDEIVVSEPDSIDTKPSTFEPSCAESEDGAITLIVFGGTPLYQYLWNTGATTRDIANLGAGTYSVTITDANGCVFVDSIDLEAPLPLQISLDSLADISCQGLTDGYLKVSGLGGTSPYQYSWNTGSSSSVLPNRSPGVYTVTVTDFNGCVQTASYELTEPEVLVGAIVSIREPICVGDNTGQIIAAATGGTAPFTFEWNTGEMGDTLEQVGVDTYFVKVTDFNGCQTENIEVVVNSMSVLDLDITIIPPLCVGQNDGAVELNPNGTPPFSYEWERGDTIAQIFNVEVGTYDVTIMDGQGCIYDTTVVVDAPQVFDVDLDVFDPSCFGGMDGVIDLVLNSSGTLPFTYNWSDGSMASDRVGIGAGEYSLTISDANGCTFESDTMELVTSLPMAIKIDGLGEILCNGDETGFIEIRTFGGIPPYTYNWNAFEYTSEDIYDLRAGAYDLQILDANSCPFDTLFVLAEPALLIADIEITVADICESDTTNMLLASATGGTPPYQYSWSNGAMGNSQSNVEPGEYDLTVSDANLCEDVITAIKVREVKPALTIDTIFTDDVSCFGGMDGTMTVIVSGGSGQNSFFFSNGQNFVSNEDTVTIGNLSVDNDYFVVITDLENGCIQTSQFNSVSSPMPLNVRIDDISAITCFEGSDGSIFASASGGTAPYQFVWTNSNGTVISQNQNLLFVPSGTYNLRVTDNAGCQGSINNLQINLANDVIQIVDSLTLIQHVACRGDSTGLISISLSGGAPPFSYQWSNGSTNGSLVNVPAGFYGLTITDSDTCVAIFPNVFQVTQPATELVMDTAFIFSSTCTDTNDGRLEVVMSGGAMPFDIEWSYENNFIENEHDLLIENAFSGSYQLSVLDANGCLKMYDFEVPAPPALELDLITSPPQNGSGGSIEAEVTGGTPAYSYQWNTSPLDTTAVIDHLDEGFYSVTITDAIGCTLSDSIFLVPILDQVVLHFAKLYPNPTTDKVNLELALDQTYDLDIEVFNLLGQRMDRQAIRLQRGLIQLELNAYPAGTYWVAVKAEGQRVYTERVVIVN